MYLIGRTMSAESNVSLRVSALLMFILHFSNVPKVPFTTRLACVMGVY